MKNLVPFLEPLGFSFTSTGMMMREKMKEFKNPRADLLEDDTHSHVETVSYTHLDVYKRQATPKAKAKATPKTAAKAETKPKAKAKTKK